MKVILTQDDPTYKVLEKLLNGPISGEDIAKELEVSRTSIWKTIRKLKRFGYEIESKKGFGYELKSCPDLSPFEVLKICKKLNIIGQNKPIKEIHYYKIVDSTNIRAKDEGKPNLLIIAEKQTKGKGRFGRTWHSEKGGLYFTITLPRVFSIQDLPKVSLLAGISVCKALKFLNARLKWPNDVLINGKKVCGILCETIGEYESPLVIIGIGVNVNNDLPHNLSNAVSIKDITGKPERISKILESILSNFFNLYDVALKQNWNYIINEWRKLSDTIGKKVKVITPTSTITGLAIDINNDGNLLVKSDSNQVHAISAGECIHLR